MLVIDEAESRHVSGHDPGEECPIRGLLWRPRDGRARRGCCYGLAQRSNSIRDALAFGTPKQRKKPCLSTHFVYG
jgi:hypothetical protein